MKEETRLREIEKDYGVKFKERGDMRLSNWLKREGLNSLGKALKKIEQKLLTQTL